jgi:hypothetical protein
MTSRAFTSAKFQWIERVTRDHKLLAIDVRIAAALLSFFNERDNDGRAFPSCKTIADLVGAGEASVIRSVRRLHARGHLIVVWGKPGRGHPNNYWMAGKPAPVKVFEAVKPPSGATVKPPSDANKTSTGGGEPFLDDSERGVLTEHLSRERESDALARVSIPGGGAAPFGGAPTLEEQEAGLAKEESYSELRAVWRRPWADNEQADRAAFDTARQEVAPAAIVAAAKTWAAAVEPRFLPSLAKWLNARGWEKPHQRKKASRSTGEGRRNGRKRDMSAEFFKLGSKRDVFGGGA